LDADHPSTGVNLARRNTVRDGGGNNDTVADVDPHMGRSCTFSNLYALAFDLMCTELPAVLSFTAVSMCDRMMELRRPLASSPWREFLKLLPATLGNRVRK
jgi:hypothetical protein